MGCLKAETLAHVLNVTEEERQQAAKPEPSRQLSLHLAFTLEADESNVHIDDASDHGAVPHAVQGHVKFVACGPNEANLAAHLIQI